MLAAVLDEAHRRLQEPATVAAILLGIDEEASKKSRGDYLTRSDIRFKYSDSYFYALENLIRLRRHYRRIHKDFFEGSTEIWIYPGGQRYTWESYLQTRKDEVFKAKERLRTLRSEGRRWKTEEDLRRPAYPAWSNGD